MEEPHAQDFVTQVLRTRSPDDPAAASEILPVVYDSLRDLAHQRLAREPAGQTLHTTDLVHEAYVRLLGAQKVRWENRRHFFAAAAEAMRRIMIERARARRASKRGGNHKRQDLVESMIADPDWELAEPDRIVALDEVLTQLEQIDPRKSEIVKFRFFAGLTIAQTARSLGLSVTTVKDEWQFARAWLRNRIEKP